MGAIGLLVHRLAEADDVIVGEAGRFPPFAGRRFFAAARPFWPLFGRADRYGAGVVQTLRRLRPALVEVHNRPGIAARVARALPHTPTMLFVHNDPQAMRGAKAPAERAGLLRRMRIVCVSEYLARRFMEKVDSGAEPAWVLPNALDLSALPARLPADAREKTILFAGRTVADKGADAFVRACAAVLPSLPGWRAEIIGADRFWPGSTATPFERTLAEAAATAGVALRGYRPHADVLQAMARAAIVVVPSRWAEPFGLTALEAMASGAALVCSRRGGLPEVAGEAAFYADPDEAGALEAAILALAGDAALLGWHASRGLVRAGLFDATRARARLGELRAAVIRTR